MTLEKEIEAKWHLSNHRPVDYVSRQMSPEQAARQQTDALLHACSWLVQDHKKLDLGAGPKIAVCKVPLLGDTANHLLFVDHNVVGVVEAKKLGAALSGVEEQSSFYASNLAPFSAANSLTASCLSLRVHRSEDFLPGRTRSTPAVPPRLHLLPAGNPCWLVGQVRHLARPLGQAAFHPSSCSHRYAGLPDRSYHRPRAIYRLGSSVRSGPNGARCR